MWVWMASKAWFKSSSDPCELEMADPRSAESCSSLTLLDIVCVCVSERGRECECVACVRARRLAIRRSQAKKGNGREHVFQCHQDFPF